MVVMGRQMILNISSTWNICAKGAAIGAASAFAHVEFKLELAATTECLYHLSLSLSLSLSPSVHFS
jgi:hypothetical protein